jgi:hypothetical protein
MTMPDRNHEGFRAYLKRVGRPVVTDEERARAKKLRDKGKSIRAISKLMGRALSTVFFMLNPRRT